MDKNNQNILLRIFKEYEIEYWTKGKNVSFQSINIQCPFCEDHSNHCGIFYNDMTYHCWRCSAKGPVVYLFQKLFRIPKYKAKEILGAGEVDFKTDVGSQIEALFEDQDFLEENKIVEQTVVLPPYAEAISKNTKYSLLYRYLKRRNISLETVIKAGCHVCQVGPSMSRMVIPIREQGKLVAYQAADLTGKAEIKYQTSKNKINEYIYNYDAIKRKGSMILTEGILDCWRVKNNAVAHFGTSLTKKQQRLIINKELENLLFCWDGDAYWKAVEEADYFMPFVPNVKVIALPDGEDPDSLGYNNIWKLINKEIGV
jgi:hypothetical protein